MFTDRRVPGCGEGGRARREGPRQGREIPEEHQADEGGVRPELREESAAAPNVKKGKNKFDLAEQIREDIRDFKKKNKLDRLVMVWCGSTEVFMKARGRAQGFGVVREGHEGESSGDCAVDAVCLCRD